MKPTPRTDQYVDKWIKDRIALWPDFARQLETELNELKTTMGSHQQQNQAGHPQGKPLLLMHGTRQDPQHRPIQRLEDPQGELKRWKDLAHALAACLGCGCTQQLGLCVQCHNAQKRYRACQIPLQ
jgi:hypothetical protein